MIRRSFSMVLRGKRDFYNAVLKDRVLFKQTQSSIEIDVIVVRIYMSF